MLFVFIFNLILIKLWHIILLEEALIQRREMVARPAWWGGAAAGEPKAKPALGRSLLFNRGVPLCTQLFRNSSLSKPA